MAGRGSRTIECEGLCLSVLTEDWIGSGAIAARLAEFKFSRSMIHVALMRLASRQEIAIRQTTLQSPLQYRKKRPSEPAAELCVHLRHAGGAGTVSESRTGVRE